MLILSGSAERSVISMAGLSPEKIEELLKVKKPYPIPKQYGPLRRFENEMRCASRGCGSPTYLQLNGIPRCSVHAMKLMNEMLMTEEERDDAKANV